MNLLTNRKLTTCLLLAVVLVGAGVLVACKGDEQATNAPQAQPAPIVSPSSAWTTIKRDGLGTAGLMAVCDAQGSQSLLAATALEYSGIAVAVEPLKTMCRQGDTAQIAASGVFVNVVTSLGRGAVTYVCASGQKVLVALAPLISGGTEVRLLALDEGCSPPSDGQLLLTQKGAWQRIEGPYGQEFDVGYFKTDGGHLVTITLQPQAASGTGISISAVQQHHLPTR